MIPIGISYCRLLFPYSIAKEILYILMYVFIPHKFFNFNYLKIRFTFIQLIVYSSHFKYMDMIIHLITSQLFNALQAYINNNVRVEY